MPTLALGLVLSRYAARILASMREGIDRIVVQGSAFGSSSSGVPVDDRSCGTCLALRYFATAILGGVPSSEKIARTLSPSTSWRTRSTLFRGLYPSSREIT